jgi:hypothetical protein
MKKGCFIKIVIVLTIVIAAIAYIIQNKFDDFIFQPGKKIIAPLFLKSFTSELKYVRDSPQKDSLKALVKSYIENAQNVKDLSEDSLKVFFRSIDYSIIDSVITNAELDNIRKLINQKELR